MTVTEIALDQERTDLLAALGRHRWFLTYTMQGLTDEQAATRTTASELTLSGILHHLTETEMQWTDFIVHGPGAMTAAIATWMDPAADLDPRSRFRLRDGETLADALAAYAELGARTHALIASLPSLDADHALPSAPWFEPGARWSARRVLLHLIAEISQHAGHADIVREALDGQRTMG
ncbi:MAG TPA: DinB family protein [Candidatus Nanopelagicales bacterium]|nr:DinB family protein [Candidatus Nanopelagicales bacterium]